MNFPTSVTYFLEQVLSASSAQHAISTLSLTAGCQWPTTWCQSVASPATNQTHTAVCVTRRCKKNISLGVHLHTPVAWTTATRCCTASPTTYINECRLQSVQNAAVRLITRTGRREHISPVMQDVQHWCSSRYTAAHRIISQTHASRRLKPVAIPARLAP